MDMIDSSAPRDANGRFVPGQSGNPAGKRPGTRNRATLLRAALAEGEDIAAARIVIDKALSGDAVAARFILGRLTPRPRGRAISLDLPAGSGAGGAVAAFDATLRAMASGEITPDEALTVTRVLDGKVKALKARAREKSSPICQGEPSPFGRGPSTIAQEGEGARNSPTDSSLRAASSPHPNPLPEGEGMRTGVGERLASAARAAGDFRARLLHSTCISPLPAAAWRAAGSALGGLVGGEYSRLC